MNKGPNATICLVRRQNHAGTTVSWTTVQREKSSHAYKLSSNVQTACSMDSLNNCPKHSILRFSSFALKIYLWLKMCQHNLPCSIVYAHCLLPGRAFASLYVLLFLEKEAVIGDRVNEGRKYCRMLQYFWPALCNNWSWKPIFGLFESGHFTQALLYLYILEINLAYCLIFHMNPLLAEDSHVISSLIWFLKAETTFENVVCC